MNESASGIFELLSNIKSLKSTIAGSFLRGRGSPFIRQIQDRRCR